MTKEIIVEISSYVVTSNPTKLICLSLGSCLGIALHEPEAKLGGLGHAMLPLYQEGRNKSNLAKYVDTSIYLMVDEIVDKGGKKRNIYAKLVGGSKMFQSFDHNMLDIGQRNTEAAIETLKKEKIKIKSKDVGGTKGRTIYFDLSCGKIRIKSSGEKIKVI